MRAYFGIVLGIALTVCMGGLEKTALGDVIYSEAVSGDLSNNSGAPTARTLFLGVHTITGTAGSGDTQDWINLTVPNGTNLTSIVLDAYESSDAKAFIGVQAGTSFVGPDQEAASYLGYTHFGPSILGGDVLALMGDAFGSQGFDPPLGPGSYSFLIQQFGDTTNYQFSVSVVAVPEPAAAGLAACCAAGLFARRRASI